jgi:hypothetical protein
MRKFDIARMLAKKFAYTSYLEIVTPSTGGTYAQVDREQLTQRMRLMYRRPAAFSDGELIDFGTTKEDAEELYFEVMQRGLRFELVFVDPFHTYACSLRDIVYALQLTKPEGIVLIHDCDPPNEEIAGPEFRHGDWCGVTYVAYLDLVLQAQGLHYVTVDTDYGCGIISKTARPELFDKEVDAALRSEWQKLELTRKFGFFERNRLQLLHLISPEELTRRLGG